MTSSLATQLGRIKTKSPNPLDLKAQKSAHSQSLLFSARDAATQDFDTLFLICYEGFEELCRLDARFTGFVHNIFSEQSKYEDRNQMTVLQNSQLDAVLEDFLALVGSKLLLKPSQKAVEWLIRRFKVHEKNTLCLVLTFLPYHTSPLFSTLLTILPQNQPPTLKFLYPYIKSQANPPRHVIVYTAAHDKAFFARLNARVLEVSKSGRHFPALLSFWASIVTEAVAAMIDQSRSGRQEAQIQKQEDLLHRIVPTLNEGLTLKNVPDLQVGCYMIFAVLATKASLSTKLSTAMMGTVALNWSQTKEAGLICMLALARQKDLMTLPKQVLKSLLAMDGLVETLIRLKSQYKVEDMTLGILLGISQDVKALDSNRIELASSLIKADLINDSYLTTAIAALLSVALKPHQDVNVKSLIEDLLRHLAEDQNIGLILEDAIKIKYKDLAHLEPGLQRLISGGRDDPFQSNDDMDIEDVKSTRTTETFDDAISNFRTQTANTISFLSPSESDVFDDLAQIFVLASSSTKHLKIFSDLAILRKSHTMNEPLFLTFFIRFWCGNYPVKSRAAAINLVSLHLRGELQASDTQIVLPYLLYGLSDPSSEVRRASVNLVKILNYIYNEKETEKVHMTPRNTGPEQIYGQKEPTNHLMWLSSEESARFTKGILLPSLEEFLLDPRHISQLLSDALSDPRHSRSSHPSRKELKAGTRQNVFAFLCSHTANTPLYAVRFRLLQALNQIEKVGNISRTKALLPLVSESVGWSQRNFESTCSKEQIDPQALLNEIFRIVLPTDRNGVHILQEVIESEKRVDTPLLLTAAYQRIRSIWGTMKPDSQSSLAKVMLELATSERYNGIAQHQHNEAVDTLQRVPLSTTILESFLEVCATFSSDLHENSFPSKRRRTSHGFTVASINQESNDSRPAIRRLTLVLELVEACQAEQHPQLIKGLFQVLLQLQLCRNNSGMDLGYLQVLTMGNILAIVKSFKKSSYSQIDQSAFQPNIIVDSVRATTSAQVQHVALLLISALASITPELVLHSVMPIFTFMSASILRQSDEYSAYVVNQIMESVIPRLVESLNEREKDPIRGISELLLSFVAAFEHIPSQRRLEIFKSLTDKIGSTEFLYALLVILLDKYPGNKEVVQFSANLIRRYDIRTQFLSIEKYLGVILDIFKPIPNLSEFLVTTRSNCDANTVVADLLPLLTVFFNTPDLSQRMRKAFDLEDDNATTLRQVNEQVIEHVLTLSSIVKDDKTAKNLIDHILESLLDLLSTPELIKMLESLLARAQDDIRLQMLQSFQRRLNSNTRDLRTAQGACVGLLLLLTSILEETASLPLRCASLSTVDTVVKRLGKTNKDAVFAAASVIANDHIMGASESKLRMAALLCLTSAIESLRDAIIPIVPLILPQALDQLTVSAKEDAEYGRLHNAAYSLISALLSYIPWMISGRYIERLLKYSHKSANLELGGACSQSRVKTLQLIAKRLEPEDCFKALDETWENATTEGPVAMKGHLEVLRTAVEGQPKSSIIKHHEILTQILIKAFNLRHIQFSCRSEIDFRESEVDEVETAVIDSAIVIIYKLNDKTFRPMFLSIWEWTTNSTADNDETTELCRKTTFYAFLAKFFDTLRSIVTSYAGYIIDDAVNTLKGLQLQNNESKLLWKRVVVALHKSFEHDQDDFWQSPSHFSPVKDALLSQFTHAPQISMTSELIPAITELAASADSQKHHQDLNTAILKHMRSGTASIRLAAIQCQHSLTNRLGEEWLGMVAEMLPFISELQEDDDEAVEKELQGWIASIEGVLGESLDPHLR